MTRLGQGWGGVAVSKRFRIGALLIAALILICGVTAVSLRTPQPVNPPALNLLAEGQPTLAKMPPMGPKRSIASIMPRLKTDLGRAFTVLIFSDSTGASSMGWVPLVARGMADATGRMATVHPWSVEAEPDGYSANWLLTKGKPPGVVVWNATASGKNLRYISQHLSEMTGPIDPTTVDLILLSEGHNESGGMVTRALTFVGNMTSMFPNAAVVSILQNPERPGTPHARIMSQIVRSLASEMPKYGYQTIDVNTPYSEMSNWQNEFASPTETFHPSRRGYILWANVVKKALSI